MVPHPETFRPAEVDQFARWQPAWDPKLRLLGKILVGAQQGRVAPDDITLFGEGLGLDSIDALELVLEIERTFGVAIGDEQTATRALASVNAIAEFIEERRGGLERGSASVA